MESGLAVPAPTHGAPGDALARAAEKRQDGAALLSMHGAMGNLVQANGALCQVGRVPQSWLICVR